MNVNFNLNANDRFDFWTEFINNTKTKKIVELGVYKGEFARHILKNCKIIEKYIMIDPWRKLDNWNKPANTEDDIFEGFYEETIEKTKFAKNKIEVLRGRTQDVQNKIKDNSLDFAYIDGDHTLKGITIDLFSIWSKIKPNGFIAGDDFCSSIWQHSKEFEPTFVFPYAAYFAEAVNSKIYGLPFNQFLIEKGNDGFSFIDLTNGSYDKKDILSQLSRSGIKNSNNTERGNNIFQSFFNKNKNEK